MIKINGRRKKRKKKGAGGEEERFACLESSVWALRVSMAIWSAGDSNSSLRPEKALYSSLAQFTLHKK